MEWRAHDGGTWRQALPALPLVAAQLGLLLVFDLAAHPVLTLGLLAASFLALAVAARRLETGVRPQAVVLGVALLLRLAALPLPATLSDDTVRYLWDGKVARAGLNPYTHAPEAPALAPLRDEAWRRMPHHDVPTVYPPLAITAFSIATLLPFPFLGWKALAVGADLAACVLLLRLAGRRGLPPGRVAWYAWNPLVVLEVAGMGHVDALGVAATVGAVYFLTRRPEDGRTSPARAALCAAAGVLAKLAPLALLPLWSRRSGRPLLFAAIALGLVAVGFLPVALAGGGIPPGLLRYGVSWEFNGPLYEPLWRLLDGVGAAPFLHGVLGRIEALTGIWHGLDFLYAGLYPRFLAKAILGLGMLAAVAWSTRETDPVEGTGRLLGRLLLLSATVYPWYVLWVLPWAALQRRVPWLLLSGLLPLCYLPAITAIQLHPWVFLLIWGPFWAAHGWFRRTGAQNGARGLPNPAGL